MFVLANVLGSWRPSGPHTFFLARATNHVFAVLDKRRDACGSIASVLFLLCFVVMDVVRGSLLTEQQDMPLYFQHVHCRFLNNNIIITSLINAWQTAGWYTTASHRYERCWSGASRLPTARSSLQAAYSQHLPCGALVPAEAGPNFAAWWAGVHVCEQLTQGCYAVCLGRASNSRPSDRESRTLTIEPPRHTSCA